LLFSTFISLLLTGIR